MSWQNLPEELKLLPQWVGVRVVWNAPKGKFDKFPVDPKTGKAGSVSEPSTWGTFAQACGCGLEHIGFVLTEYDPYTIIDLDTKKDPRLSKLHAEVVIQADSFTETSVSGEGSHIIGRAKLEHGLRDDRNGLEIYPHGRFILLTGWQYHGDQIMDIQEVVDYLSGQITESRFETGELVTEEATRTDEDLYHAICAAENGDKFQALWEGTWQNYQEYQDDHSRADLALATFLDFYTKNVDQAIRLFKHSKIYRPEKGRRGGDGTDYIIRTLKQARARNEADCPPMVEATVLTQRAQEVMAGSQTTTTNTQDQEPETTPVQQITFPPGIVGEIAQYIYTSAIRPVPEVALMGALAMMAGIVGRQYNVSGSGLNLYLILLAPTGSGKEGASSGISNLLGKVRETVPSVDQFRGPAEFASGPALIRTLDNQPCVFSILGEFGLRLQTMADLRANGAEKTLQKALLNIYSKSGWHQQEESSAYSDRDKNTKTLYAPALTIFGESTPETFFLGLSERQVLSGLLPRFSFREYQGKRPPRNRVSAFCDPDPGLVQRVADLSATVIQMQANSACTQVIVDTNAQAVLDEFDTFSDTKINSGSELHKELWNRAHLKALRLAGVLAVGINAYQPVITQDLAQWAIEFTKTDITTIEARFDKNEVGEGEHRFEAEIRKVVLDYLQMDLDKRRSYKVPEKILDQQIIPYTFIRRRLRNLSGFKDDKRGVTWAIQAALKDICEAGILQAVPPLTRKQEYGISSEIYLIGESW